MLNTVVNPMLNLLGGGGNKGNQYIQIGGTLNSLTGTLTPLLVGVLIGTVTDKTAMSDVAPLLFIAMAVFAIAFVIISLVKIPEPAQERKTTVYEHSAWNFRHFVLGALAIFFYVGIEIGIPAQVNFFLSDASAKGAGIAVNGAAIGGAIAAVYWLLMMVGRFSSTLISGKVSTRTQMTVVSAVAIILVIAAIFTPKSVTVNMPGYSAADGFAMFRVPLSCLFLVLCGLCTSVMWGAIFNLAVEGLGKYTESASGIFMMLVVGGGIMPLIQEYLAKGVGYMNSYWLVVAMLAYLLYYAVSGSKNVNKDIPVD
jgi:FHS family L-fucose permease-like MFS transporter